MAHSIQMGHLVGFNRIAIGIYLVVLFWRDSAQEFDRLFRRATIDRTILLLGDAHIPVNSIHNCFASYSRMDRVIAWQFTVNTHLG